MEKIPALDFSFAREVLSITKMTITETGEAGRGARFEINGTAGGFPVCR